MVIKVLGSVPLIGFALLIDPLDKEKPTLPCMVGVKHSRHQPQVGSMAHKVVKTPRHSYLLQFVAIEELLKHQGMVTPT